MSRIKTMILSLMATLGLMFPMSLPVLAASDVNPELCKGVVLDPNITNCDDITGGAGDDVSNIAKNVIDILTWVVGIVSVVMIIVAGLRYITSGGESGKVTGAKNTIMYAGIGLVIAILAQTIVKYVIEKVLQ